MRITRREFMKSGASVVAIGAGVPAMLAHVAQARAEDNNASTRERILVVFELNGGNDGINTVIPLADKHYTVARPTLAIPPTAALELEKGVALHPSMTGMHELYKAGHLAVIQGAGYPNANRSHFRSMDIWHRADPGTNVNTGWIGRYYEKTDHPPTSPVSLVHYGQRRPEMFKAGKAPSISINAIDDFYPSDGKPESLATSMLYQGKSKMGEGDAMMMEDEMHAMLSDPDALIQNTGMDIVRGSEIIKKVIANRRTPKVAYPQNGIGNGLSVFSQMIVENLGSKIFYISLGGFDTHANQAMGHANLMSTLSTGIASFMADLKEEDRDKDVMVMVFSEFGRRVYENGSQGTDHGAASIMFFAGGSVKGGLYGGYPSLSDMDQGDLKYNVDFRDCYATVLADWLGTDPDRIIPGHKGRTAFL